ncbi:basic amino acid ABC transporter substrate-binding protein [Paenibacillus beijingensis]|uniref:ABC transporter substrate-binding protein n=1 Tax=Paenibacillus beijingensis TaxID=1126833 RepID=A0A0D5NGV9_9BACL|nr:basic amino acid ABC transporter substrate-binding protein [Paenibacillus beijingensis]AJY74375.1 ABC transporter substrate-binding protein [Paenibacillus beijingensis]
MKNLKTVMMFAISLVMIVTLAACGAGKNEETGSGSAKEYIVATDASYAPFESLTEKNEFIGFDIELVKAVAEKGGINIKIVNTPWEGMFATLNNGDRDLLVSAITITDERKKEYDFSDPYFEARQSMAVPNNTSIKNFAELKGKKVGVQTGTTGDEVVSKLMGADSKDIRRFETTPLALKELENGGVDAVVADNGVVKYYVKNNPDKGFKTIDEPLFAAEYYGFVMKKGNTELMGKINDGLKKIKEDGTYDAIYNKYFGE